MRKFNKGVTPRSVLIGLFLIPFVCFWVSNSEMRTGVTEITSTALLIGAIFILLLLMFLNLFIEKFFPKYAFSSSELLVIYMMVVIAMAINGIGMIGFLTPALLNPFWYATPENEWSEFHPYIPSWFVLRDAKAITFFYEGDSNFLRYIGAWKVPFVTWTSFIFVLLLTTLCMSCILSKRWMEQERLSFPIAMFPVEMAIKGGSISTFFRNKLLWIGFIIPAVLQSINTLHFIYPSVPYIQFIKAYDIGRFFVEKPWNAIGYFAVALYPTVIGLTYLFPVDISFSCAFFYLIQRLELVVASYFGFRGGGGLLARFPSVGLEGAGAWLALAVASLWMARRHLAQVFRDAFTRQGLNSSDEPISSKWALLGLILGTAFLVVFAYTAGSSIHVAILLFLIFFLYMITISRIRAQAGGIWNFSPDNPSQVMVTILGSKNLGPTNLTIISYLMWFTLDTRCAVMPHQLECLKIGREAGLKLKKVIYVVMVSVFVGIVASYLNVLRLYYHYGADTARVNPWRVNMGKIPYYLLRNWITFPQPPDVIGIIYIIGGAVMVSFLTFMSTRYIWWILHPVGYAYASTAGNMFLLWSGMLTCSVIKLLILRFGGVRRYRRYLPFFIGLLIGDYTIASIWSIFGTITGMSLYRVFPN